MNNNGDILRFVPLVHWVCRQCGETNIPREDLVQEGLLGVWQAWQRYKENRKASFETYAVYWIRKRVMAAIDRERRQMPEMTIPLESVPAGCLVAQVELTEDSDWIEQYLQPLSKLMTSTERDVLQLAFAEHKTELEIARQMQLSRARVRAMKRRVVLLLRKHLK